MEMLTVDRMAEGGFSGASKWFRCAAGIRGEYIVRCRSVLSLILSKLGDSLLVPSMGGMCAGRKGDHKPKKPKSPVCITAAAFASLAMSLRADKRPRMSAIQRIRPCTESSTFVWVLTWYWTRGAGELAGLLEAEVGLDPPCMAILEAMSNRGESENRRRGMKD